MLIITWFNSCGIHVTLSYTIHLIAYGTYRKFSQQVIYMSHIFKMGSIDLLPQLVSYLGFSWDITFLCSVIIAEYFRFIETCSSLYLWKLSK